MEKRATQRRSIAFISLTVLLLLYVFFSTCAYADVTPNKLKIEQISAEHPKLTVFARLSDVADNPVFPGPGGKVSAKINGVNFEPLSTDVYSKLKNGLAIVFVVDISQAMPANKLADAQKAIVKQIKNMSERDYAAIVCVEDSAWVCQKFTNNTEELLKAIKKLKITGKKTELKAGILQSLDLASVINSSLPERKLVVLCTAGVDNSSSAITDDEIRQKIKSTRSPIYSIVCGTTKNSTKATTVNLGELSRLSGGNFYEDGTVGFAKAIDSITKSLDQSIVLKFDIKQFKATGAVCQFNLVFTNGKITVSDVAEVRIVAQTEADKATKENIKWYKHPIRKFKAATKKQKIIVSSSITVVVLLLIALACWLFKRNKAKKEQELLLAESVDEDSPITHTLTTSEGATVKMPRSAGHFSVPLQTAPAAPPVPHGLSIELYHTGSTADQRVIRATVSEHTIVGRKAIGNDSIVISDDTTISSRHCELNFVEGKLYVSDLQSTNGTLVNGVAINSMYPLKDGDILAVGKTELRIKILGIA